MMNTNSTDGLRVLHQHLANTSSSRQGHAKAEGKQGGSETAPEFGDDIFKIIEQVCPAGVLVLRVQNVTIKSCCWHSFPVHFPEFPWQCFSCCCHCFFFFLRQIEVAISDTRITPSHLRNAACFVCTNLTRPPYHLLQAMQEKERLAQAKGAAQQQQQQPVQEQMAATATVLSPQKVEEKMYRVFDCNAINAPGAMYKAVTCTVDTTSQQLIQITLDRFGSSEDPGLFELRYEWQHCPPSSTPSLLAVYFVLPRPLEGH